MHKYHVYANILSALRVVLMAPFVWLFYRQEYIWALLCALVAVSTDYFDGAVARSAPEKSTYGSWIDPIADACVMLTALLLFTWEDHVPLWFCAWIGLRYICFVVIAMVEKKRGHIIKSSIWNKVSIGFFAGYFFAILLSYIEPMFTVLVQPLLWITCLLQLISVLQSAHNALKHPHLQ